MTKYAKLDSEVLSAIGSQPTSFRSYLALPSGRSASSLLKQKESTRWTSSASLIAGSSRSGSLALFSTSKVKDGYSHEIANHQVAIAAFLLLAFTFNRINRQFREH